MKYRLKFHLQRIEQIRARRRVRIKQLIRLATPSLHRMLHTAKQSRED